MQSSILDLVSNFNKLPRGLISRDGSWAGDDAWTGE